MTYEELPEELKAKFRALMESGRQHEALALLNPPKPLTPEEQAKLAEELRKQEASNKRFSKFFTLMFMVMALLAAHAYFTK